MGRHNDCAMRADPRTRSPGLNLRSAATVADSVVVGGPAHHGGDWAIACVELKPAS